MVWDTSCTATATLPPYNALQDRNLRTHYEKKAVRERLYESNLVDRAGRILKLNTTKVSIIEQEFRIAEHSDAQRMKVDAYERRKLDSKKRWVREEESRKRRSQALREREHHRRDVFNEKLAQYLPQPMLPDSRQPLSTLASRARLHPQPPTAKRADRVRSAHTARAPTAKRGPRRASPAPSSSESSGATGSTASPRGVRGTSSRPTSAPMHRPGTGSSAVSEVVRNAFGRGLKSPISDGASLSEYDDGMAS